MRRRSTIAGLLMLATPSLALASGPPAGGGHRPLPRFERVVIDADIPAGYQVEVADVDGDGRLDIVGLGGDVCAWYQNPSWTKRIVSDAKTTPGIISTATADLDGDGRAEIAIAHDFAMEKPTRGALSFATQGPDAAGPWKVRRIAEIGSIHRLRWGDVDGDRKLDLVVAPIFGASAHPPEFDQAPARLTVSLAGGRPESGSWAFEAIGERPITHAIKVLDLDGDGRSEVLAANHLGVSLFDRAEGGGWAARPLSRGAEGEAPKGGSSEIHVGRLADGTRFLATVEPWHGTQVTICPEDRARPGSFGPRAVIDDSLRDGHALWVADVDGDGDDEVFAGYRADGTSVLAFDFDGKGWTRTVLDREIAAQDLRGGDLDGDGTPDVVAIGGKTHNLIWYRPVKE